jgi:hypothetical protein
MTGCMTACTENGKQEAQKDMRKERKTSSSMVSACPPLFVAMRVSTGCKTFYSEKP